MSVTDNVAVRESLMVGRNLTLIVQLEPAARLVPHVLVCEKLEAFVPPIAILLIVSAAVPVFDNVTVLAALVVLMA